MYITTSTFFNILRYIDTFHLMDTIEKCPTYFKTSNSHFTQYFLSNIHQKHFIYRIESLISPELSPHIHIRTHKRKPPRKDLVFNEPTNYHYHLHDKCETLNNEYKNLIIPAELEKRAREHTEEYGIEEGQKIIEDFRNYAKHRRKEMGYEFIYTDAFALELATKFNLKDIPQVYVLKNSGYGEIDSQKITQDLCEQYDKELLTFFHSDDIGKELYKMYQSNISIPVMENLILQRITEEESLKYLTKLSQLKDILLKITHLYIALMCKEYATKDIHTHNWDKHFLEKLDIKPCGVCHNEFIKPKRNTTYDTVTPVITKQPPPETDDLPF